MATTKNEMLDTLLQRMDNALANGQRLPWQKPWEPKFGDLSAPHNPTTERLYSPLNGLILSLSALEHGYEDPRWMGFNQAKEQGWSVRRGEHAAARIFSPIVKNEINPRTGLEEPCVVAYRGTPLFNTAQIDGIPPMREIPEQERLPKTAELDAIAQQMGVAILHSGSAAFYSLRLDRIQLPPRDTFIDQHGYDATKAHELSHATGHESRLNRDSIRQYTSIKGRAAEEVTAEIGSYLLSTRLGVPFMGNNPDMTDAQHTAYLTTWAKDLSPDERRAAVEQGIKAAGHLEKQLELARENGLVTELGKQAPAQFHAKGREVVDHDRGMTPDVKAAMGKKQEKVLSGPSDKNVVAMGDLMAGDFVRVSHEVHGATRHTDAIVLKVTKDGISGKIIQPVREKTWTPEPVPGQPARDSHWMFAAAELKTALKPGGAYISAHEPNAVPGIVKLDATAKAGLATDGEKLALHMSLNRFMKTRGEQAIARTNQPLHKITLTHRTDLKDRVLPVSIPGEPDRELRNHPRQEISGVLKDFSKSEFILETEEFGQVRVETGKNMFMEREEELRAAVGKPVDIAIGGKGTDLSLAVHQGQGVSVMLDRFDTPARPFGLMPAVDMGKTTAQPVTGKLTHVHDSNVLELRSAGKPLQGANPLQGATPVLVYGPEPDKAHQAEIRKLIGKQVRVSADKNTGRLAVKAIQPKRQQDIGLER
ncbi:ArdC family protein [Acidithiobacillus ferrivorans]|nr:zincin-like metallopeptidase domain-containing protein [Acidithiobacillus ferrivorans]